MAGRDPRVTDDELLAVFEAAESPFLTVQEVAEHVDLGRRGTDQRLRQLVEQDDLDTRMAGRTRIFWLPERIASRE